MCFPNTDSSYVVEYEQAGYERRLGDSVPNICNIDETNWSFFWTMLSPICILTIDFTTLPLRVLGAVYRLRDVYAQQRPFHHSLLIYCGGVHVASSTELRFTNHFFSVMAFEGVLLIIVFVSVPSPAIFANYSAVVLDDKFGASSLCHPTITVYCAISLMHFLVITCDWAVYSQCPNSRLLLLSCCMLVLFLLPMRLQTRVHDFWFRRLHLYDGPAFDHASTYVAFQRSAEVDLTLCDMDEGWFYYTLDSGSVHDGLVEGGRYGVCKTAMVTSSEDMSCN